MTEDFGLNAESEMPAKLGHVQRLRAKVGAFAEITIKREDGLEARIEQLERQIQMLLLAGCEK